MPISEMQINNGSFRVTRWDLEPGDTMPMHVHEYEYVVVPLTEGILWVTDAEGTETAVELSVGQSIARPAGVAHTIANRGTAWIRFVEIEKLS
jgi:quercetin dioxygenase-like cupin family protein